MCVSASSRTPAACAASAASAAVECRVSRARSRSSAQNVASWTSRSTPAAASTTDAAGRRVAGEHDGAPGPRRSEHLLGAHDLARRER